MDTETIKARALEKLHATPIPPDLTKNLIKSRIGAALNAVAPDDFKKGDYLKLQRDIFKALVGERVHAAN